MERETTSRTFSLGSTLPEFELPNVDGRKLGSSYLKGSKAALVVFSCNHCPYVKGSEEMLIEIVRRFESQSLKTVAVNSNDSIKYPEDGFEKMREKSDLMKLPYPYLYDENQDVARAFDAQCTPEFYLFNASGELVYHGTINDSPRDRSKVTKDYLSDAIAAVLAGKTPDPNFVHPLGCSIKWR